MFIAYSKCDLLIETSQSLKDKRKIIQSLVVRLRSKFNVSVAEIEHLDSWQKSKIAVVLVSNDALYCQKKLSKINNFLINDKRWDFQILTIEQDIISGI